MEMFTCVVATQKKRNQYVGIYRDAATPKRIIANIAEFAGIGWQASDSTQIKTRGVFHVPMLRKPGKSPRTQSNHNERLQNDSIGNG